MHIMLTHSDDLSCINAATAAMYVHACKFPYVTIICCRLGGAYVADGGYLFAPHANNWVAHGFDYDFLIQLLFKSYNFIFTARARRGEKKIDYKKIYMATLAACK